MSSPSIQRTCYTRNGTAITDVAYQACSTDPTRDAPCCGTNHQGAGHLNVANDVCDTNGLCQNFEGFDGTNEGVKIWWRQGCTDPTWESEACLKNVCNYAKWQVDNAPVRNCGNGNWCCGDNNCCLVTSSLFKLAAAAPTASPSSSRASAGPTVTTSVDAKQPGPSQTTSVNSRPPEATGSDPSTSPEPSSSGLGTGAKAGIGVGIAVVVLLLAIIAFLLVKLRKRKQGAEKASADAELSAHQQQEKPYTETYAHQAASPVEMDGQVAPVELGSPHAVELPGSDGAHMKASR